MLFSVFLLTITSTFVYEYNAARREAAVDQLPGAIKFAQTFNNLNYHARASLIINAPNTEQPPFYSIKNIKAAINTAAKYCSDHSAFIFMIWLVFFMVKSASMAGNMIYMHRARRYRVNEPEGYWKERVAVLCEKLQLQKTVSLLESAYIKVPVVIGYFKPVILIPVGLIARIPAAQVEAVLLHELAHIRRNDYMVNFLQNVVEAVFFFNPGLLWISARLREERENCCDDVAIAQTNNKEEFVQALISFKEYTMAMPAYATAFSGQKNSLLNRIMRIAYQENKTLSVKESGIFLIGVAMLLLTAFTVYPAKEAKAIKALIATEKNNNPGPLFTKSLNKANIIGGPYKSIAIPQITASGGNVTGIGNADDALNKSFQPVMDSTKLSAIGGINLLKGPNFIVVIDGLVYPKDILYKISPSCIAGCSITNPEYGKKKYGFMASDGYVDIKTKHGQITYLTPIEKENLVVEASIPRFKFYNRISLKKEDGSIANDKIVMNLAPPGNVAATLPHDGKAGFYIDKNFYTEETIQNVSLATIASFTGEYGVEGSDPNVPREKGYSLIFKFNTKKTSAILPATDTVKYARVIGENLGPKPLVLINGKEYAPDILSKISPSCFSGSATLTSQPAVKKFGNKAKDGCVEITIKGPIVYLTQKEWENTLAEKAVPKSAFITRVQFKGQDGKLEDEIIEQDRGGTTTMTLAHNAKAAFFLGNDFYTEEQIKKLPPEKIMGYQIASVRNLDPKKYPNVNLHNYEVVFYWTNDKNYTYPYELHLPAD